MSWQLLVPYVSRWGNTDFALWLGQSTWRIAGLLTVHLFGLTLLLGAAVVSSIQALTSTKSDPQIQFGRDASRVARVGLVLILASGFLIFTGGAEAYYGGFWFRLKMCLLAAALLFYFTAFRIVWRDASRFSLTTARLTAVVNLLLWFSVACAGRAIAFF